MLVSTFTVTFALESAVGSGSNNPIIISSKEEFIAFANKANSAADGLDGKYYLLTTDIDFEGANIDSYSIGSEAYPFKGHLDGNGHVIKNFKLTNVSNKPYRGLFDVIGGNATIKNLGVVNANYTVNTWMKAFGGLVGYMIDNTEVIGCFAKGTTFVAPDTTTAYLGIGGGLVGCMESDNTYVTNCYSTGNDLPHGNIDYDGGLVGQGKKFGGIENCFTDTYTVRASDTYPDAVRNCYYVVTPPWPWATGSWGYGIYPGTQVTEEELKAVPESLAGIFEKSNNGGYPCFLWESYTSSLGGLGSIENPYLIKTIDDLKAVADFGTAKYLNFRLENDIDLGGATWKNYIGDIAAPFQGTFDGNGHVISNYKIIMGEKPRGLFSAVGGDGVVRNLGVKNVTFEHDTWRLEAGGIVGRLMDNGTVSGCFAKNMSASRPGGNTGTEAYAIGGLIGKIDGAGATLTNSYAYKCDFLGSYIDHDSGLVGVVTNYKNISNLYTDSHTMRFNCTDGSGVSNVFAPTPTTWPHAWTGSNTGYIGTWLTDDELKACASRLGNAFVNDPVEGYINDGYPVLAWETGDTSLAFKGDGTEYSPYLISSAQHFNYIADMNITKGKYFKMTGDIDFSGNALANIIGSANKPFDGYFDGNGHIIKNFDTTVTAKSYGLFGVVGGNAVIKNVGIESSKIYSDMWADYVGGLVGRLEGSATVEGCYAKNITITAKDTSGLIRRGGGLIGGVTSADATVKNCYAVDTVANGAEVDYEGGLIGAITEACLIENCYSNTSFLRCSTSISYNIINSYALVFSSWAASGQAYVGTKITEDSLKSEGAAKLGDAYSNDIEPLQNNGFPILNWQVKSYLLGSGTVNDPYLIRNVNDLKLAAGYTNSKDLYFKLTDDIDIGGKKWVTSIGTSDAFFKGYFDGNGKVIKNFVIDVNTNANFGLFGAIGGNAHIYNLGVENVSINATTNGGTVGGLLGSVYDNGKITGCFAKNVTFNTSSNKVSYGGGLIGRIYAKGAEIKSCYTLGTSGLSNATIGGGFAGVAELFAYFEDCYSDTTLVRYKDGLTIENSYYSQTPTDSTDGYTWGDMVKNVAQLDYDWSNDFVPNLNAGPSLKWEKYKGYYLNMIPNSAMDTDKPDSLFKTTGAFVVDGTSSGRNSEVLKMPRTTTFKYDLDMVRDSVYRVSFMAKTQGGTESTAMSLYLGGINLSEQFVADKITNDWTKKVIYVKPEATGVNRLAIGGESAIYLDNVEVELVNQSAELAEVSATLVHMQPETTVSSFSVMTEICDGLEVVYTNEDNYIDGSGNLIVENIPAGEGTVETDYVATVNIADKSISKSVTLSLAKVTALSIDSIELLKADNSVATTVSEAVKVGKVKVSIAPERNVDLIVALYNGNKLVSMKQLAVSASNQYEFNMDASSADSIKVFMFERGTLSPVLENVVY